MQETCIVTETTDDGKCSTQKEIIGSSSYISYIVSLLFNPSVSAFVATIKSETGLGLGIPSSASDSSSPMDS